MNATSGTAKITVSQVVLAIGFIFHIGIMVCFSVTVAPGLAVQPPT